MGLALPAISLALSVSVLAAAQAQPPADPASAGLARVLLRPVLPHEIVPPAGLRPDPGDTVRAVLAALRAGSGFTVELDPLTGRPARATGGRIPWLPGAGNLLVGPAPHGSARREALLDCARSFVHHHAELYRLPDSALVADEAGTVSVEREELDVVRFGLAHDGVPVLGANLVFVVRSGDLVYFGSSHALAPGEGALRRANGGAPLDRGAASAIVLGRAGLPAGDVVLLPPRRGEFLLPALGGGGLALVPVSAVRFRPRESSFPWEGWVDRSSGELVALFPVDVGTCDVSPTWAPARVVGGVRAWRGDDPEAARPLPSADLGGGLFAAPAGAYAYNGVTVRSELRGRYAWINCIACQNPIQAHLESDEAGDLDFGFSVPGLGDQRGNGSSTLAARTAFHSVNRVRALAAKWLGSSLSFLEQSLEVQVNGQSACNASWNGIALRLFQSSAECRNTAEVGDIVAHEWGHALDDFDGTGISDPGMSEGVGDVLALLLTHDSCIAETIYLAPPLSPPSDRCPGVRDLDEKAPGLDHDPVVLTVTANDCLGGVHCRGEIYGQAAWHLAYNLASGKSYATGQGVGLALGDAVAWETMERLYMMSRPLAEALDPAASGLSLYDAYLLADREASGNYPHAAAIDEAFRHHGLAEAGPAPGGTSCAAPAEPVLTGPVTQLADGGQPAIILFFNDVDATRYRVLRRRAGGVAAFEPVGAPVPDDDRVRYQVQDLAVENGQTYEYAVLAETVSGCWSGGASRLIASLRFPEIAVAVHLEADPPPGGDGDQVLEPGEFFELHVDLEETLGLTGSRGVHGEIVTHDPLLRVVQGSAEFGDLNPGARASSLAPFVLYLDPLHPCQGPIQLYLKVFAEDFGCVVKALRITLPAAACPTGQRSDVRFVSARVVDDARDLACTDQDGVLDGGEQALIGVTVENLGAASASRVDVLLSTPEPRITFVSGSQSTLALGLAPGARAEVTFDVLAGDLACAAEVPFTAEVSAAENLATSSGEFTLRTEQDLGAGTTRFDFETGAQGFVATGQWVPSGARSNPDDLGQSFWSGAAVNLCETLTSPPLRLHPSVPSTLTLSSWYQLQGRFQAKYWDGANVYLLRSSGEVLLTPVSGRAYDASLGPLVLCETGSPAWCARSTGASWASSTFDLSPYAGEEVRVEIRYATDNRDTGEGFYVDDVTISNVEQAVCDGATCPADPGCSAPEMTLTVVASGCAGEPVTFRPQFDYFGQGSFNYDWDFGDGATEPAAIPDAPVDHLYSTAGSFVARLTARSVADPRCSTGATVVVHLAPAPVADAGPDRVAPATIGTPGFTSSAYGWQPPSGLSDATRAMPVASPSQTTHYCVTVIDLATGCARGDCTLVSVPSRCGIGTAMIGSLRQVRAGIDVVARWDLLAAAGTYDYLELTDRRDIPAVEAWNSPAITVATTPLGGAVDAGAVRPPPAEPALVFYQVVPRCR